MDPVNVGPTCQIWKSPDRTLEVWTH